MLWPRWFDPLRLALSSSFVTSHDTRLLTSSFLFRLCLCVVSVSLLFCLLLLLLQFFLLLLFFSLPLLLLPLLLPPRFGFVLGPFLPATTLCHFSRFLRRVIRTVLIAILDRVQDGVQVRVLARQRTEVGLFPVGPCLNVVCHRRSLLFIVVPEVALLAVYGYHDLPPVARVVPRNTPELAALFDDAVRTVPRSDPLTAVGPLIAVGECNVRIR
mmetsp:Transcript_40927/g.109281  ORF Transcript_40927/g.109281 Transcript_40927/m.109281 type:complete len:214 (+) Transcript_40927:1330-1971(+)